MANMHKRAGDTPCFARFTFWRRPAEDLQTVPWAQLPIRLKEALGLPLEDRGIDSLALNLSVAVQAKDYSAKLC